MPAQTKTLGFFRLGVVGNTIGILNAGLQEKTGTQYGGFHSHGEYPQIDSFLRENPIEMDDLGVPILQETSILMLEV